jgi:CDP-diacylglycerol--glycerol-3-phosphate 3-phosphatidyltransferase
MDLRTSPIGNGYYRLLENRLLPLVNRWGLNPNHLTAAGVTFAALVPPGFYLHPAVGFILMGLSGVADSLDGVLAKNRGRATKEGAFLDSSLDRISDFFYLVGFWILFLQKEHLMLATAVLFTALLLTLMISYVKARAEALGVNCRVGFMERGWRTVYLLFWALLVCVLPAHRGVVLWIGLSAYILLTLQTLTHRIRHIRSQLRVR